MPNTPATDPIRTPRELQPWRDVPCSVRHVLSDGTRYVLAMTDQGTALIPWVGSAPDPADALTFDECEAAGVDGTGRSL